MMDQTQDFAAGNLGQSSACDQMFSRFKLYKLKREELIS